MARKIIIITGSPRKQGNTNTIAAWVAEGAGDAGAQVETVDAARLKYLTNGCTACMGCQQSEQYRCIVKDEASDLIASIPEYDVVVFASPVYFFSWSAQIKMFIDRMFSLFKFKAAKIDSALGKIEVALIATAGGDMGSGLDALEIAANKIAGFAGCRAKSLLVPNCTSDLSELLNNIELKEKALAFGAALAGRN